MGSGVSVELFAKLQANFWKLNTQGRQLLVHIQDRLLLGQERYGGFKFGEHDLDQMSYEELLDFIVYISAKVHLKSIEDTRNQS